MEMQKEIGTEKSGFFSLTRKAISRVFLDLLDFSSVAACFCAVCWLLYFCFLKDFIEIMVDAAARFTNRIAWILKITGVCEFLKYITNNDRNDTDEKSTKPSAAAIDYLQPDIYDSSPAIIPVTTVDESKESYEVLRSPKTPQNSTCELILSTPKKDLNSGGKNKRDVAYVSPVQHSYFKRKILNWNFEKSRLNSKSFCTEQYPSRLSANSVHVKKVITEKLRAMSIVGDDSEDKETLFKDESPENLSCCPSLFTFFKSKIQATESPCSVRYQRF